MEHIQAVANNLKWYRKVVKRAMLKEPDMVGAGRRYDYERYATKRDK